MLRSRVRFGLVTLLALVAVSVTAGLGRWQLSRAAAKEALQAQIDARADLPVLRGERLGSDQSTDEWLHRRIVARGQWLAQHTVWLDNRPMNGRVGFYVVTPLQLEGSASVVLVQRGWVPRDFEDRTRLPHIDTPAGPVQLEGRIAPPPGKLYALGEPPTGLIRQNLDLTQFKAETGLPLVEVSIQQTDATRDGLTRDWPASTTGVDKHYGYAFQWFGLSALIAVLYVWFQIVRRLIPRQPV